MACSVLHHVEGFVGVRVSRSRVRGHLEGYIKSRGMRYLELTNVSPPLLVSVIIEFYRPLLPFARFIRVFYFW